ASLFGESRFIRRETGDRWYAKGKVDGVAEIAAVLDRHMPKAATPDVDLPAMPLGDGLIAGAERRRFDAAIAESDWATAAQVYLEALGVSSATVQADRILAAGRRARMSGDNERPAPSGLAADIIRAGKRRRGEI